MITVERLDKIQQDLEWARENADRSAQTRLFVHHVPFLLTILRPVAEAIEAERLEEEEFLAEDEEVETEDATDSESETETVGEKIKGLFKSDGDADAMDSQVDAEGDATDSQVDDENLDAVEEVTE